MCRWILGPLRPAGQTTAGSTTSDVISGSDQAGLRAWELDAQCTCKYTYITNATTTPKDDYPTATILRRTRNTVIPKAIYHTAKST